MKLYLDDKRDPPAGWVKVMCAKSAIAFLKSNSNITHISLDHDLGDDSKGTGYDVLLWIEEQTAILNYEPPEILIHTANPSARIKMESAVESINRLRIQRGHDTG